MQPVTYICYTRYPSRLIGGCYTISSRPKSVQGIIFLSATPDHVVSCSAQSWELKLLDKFAILNFHLPDSQIQTHLTDFVDRDNASKFLSSSR